MTTPSAASQFTTDFPRTAAVFEKGRGRGYHFGGQLAVRLGDRSWDFAIGDADAAGSRAMQPSDLLCWRSAGKPVTAALFLREAASRPALLDEPVASVLPDFGVNGKESITFRQVLTHTTAMRSPVTGWPSRPHEEIWNRICNAGLQKGAVPGQRAAYDPVCGWFVLGKAIAALGGGTVQDGAARLVWESSATGAAPDAFLGITDDEFDRLAAASRLAPQFDTTKSPAKPLAMHERDACTNPSPGSSLHATASQVADFYVAMLNASQRQPVTPDWLAAVVPDMVKRHREGQSDDSFQATIDFGLGVIVNSASYSSLSVPYGYGSHASPETFGHGGAQCAIGFADPSHKLAVAWCLNGLPGEPRHNQRNDQLNTAIYEDLGLAAPVA